jgi:hypothetical protein
MCCIEELNEVKDNEIGGACRKGGEEHDRCTEF